MSILSKLIQILLILTCLLSHSQEYQEVNFSQLNYRFSKDSVSVFVSLNGKPLDGKFKVMMDDSDDILTKYTLVQINDGKAEGKSEFYYNGAIIMITHFKNGMKHGLNIVYDNTGKTVIWKINWVNGKKHGLVWFEYSGDSYYIMGEEATKEEFEEYERTHGKN